MKNPLLPETVELSKAFLPLDQRSFRDIFSNKNPTPEGQHVDSRPQHQELGSAGFHKVTEMETRGNVDMTGINQTHYVDISAGGDVIMPEGSYAGHIHAGGTVTLEGNAYSIRAPIVKVENGTADMITAGTLAISSDGVDRRGSVSKLLKRETPRNSFDKIEAGEVSVSGPVNINQIYVNGEGSGRADIGPQVDLKELVARDQASDRVIEITGTVDKVNIVYRDETNKGNNTVIIHNGGKVGQAFTLYADESIPVALRVLVEPGGELGTTLDDKQIQVVKLDKPLKEMKPEERAAVLTPSELSMLFPEQQAATDALQKAQAQARKVSSEGAAPTGDNIPNPAANDRGPGRHRGDTPPL